MFGMICGCERSYTPQQNEVAGTLTPTTLTSVLPTSLATSTPAAPEKVNITFSSDPPAVDIWMDGVFIGVSPKVVTLAKTSQEVTLEFKKEGYVTATQKLTLDANRPVIAKLRASSKEKKKSF
jgi:PEGA domain